MTTSTYLTGVNNTITESGAELASFLVNGSDFTTNTNALMQRIRGWYARAWKDIQQQAYDWDFMEEQGLCNVDPGIMFYTDGTPVVQFSNNLSNGVVNILDQDGTTAIPNVSIGAFTDLTGTATSTIPFGYFSLITSSTAPISFALKPGAEYISVAPIQYNLGYTSGNFQNNLLSVPSVGQTVSIASVSRNVTSGVPTLIKDYGPVGVFVTSPSAATIFTTNNLALYNVWLAGTTSFIIYNPANSVAVAMSDYYTSASTTTWHVFLSINSSPSNVFTRSTTGFPGIPIKAFTHSWKSFNFNEELSVGDFQEVIQEIDQSSFRIIDFYKSPATGEVPLEFVPWEVFRGSYDLSSSTPGFPRIITEDDTGRYRLYPHPYYTVTIKFDYDRTPQILSAYTDTLKGLPEDFFDLVMWKALIYYGEHDEQPSVVARATKNYKTLLSRLELKNRAKFHFLPKRLY